MSSPRILFLLFRCASLWLPRAVQAPRVLLSSPVKAFQTPTLW